MKWVFIIATFLSFEFAVADSTVKINLSELMGGVHDTKTDPPQKDCDCDDTSTAAKELDQLTFDTISSKISNELNTKRTVSPFMKDCFEQMGESVPNSFEAAIRFGVSAHLTTERDHEYEAIKAYGVEKFEKKISLISAPMCTEFDDYFSAGSSETKQKVATKFKAKQLQFATTFNTLRTAYLESKINKMPPDEIRKRKLALEKFYYAFLASLAEHESLSTADLSHSDSASESISTLYKIEDYTRPEGVKFYSDPYQTDTKSKYNIGLFQFSANRTGNIHPCVQSWNQSFGSKFNKCRIKLKNNGEAMQLLGASDQVFNAFCGASKLVQSKAIQINTPNFEVGSKKRRRTPSQNFIEDRGLKAPKDRCFSPFSTTLHTYNHFGTLGHTIFFNNSGKSISQSSAKDNLSNVANTNTSRVINDSLTALSQ